MDRLVALVTGVASATSRVVDFVASISRGRRWNFVANWVFRRFSQADIDALVKLKKSVALELVSEQEHARFGNRPWSERVARRVGSEVRKLSRRLFTRKHNS